MRRRGHAPLRPRPLKAAAPSDWSVQSHAVRSHPASSCPARGAAGSRFIPVYAGLSTSVPLCPRSPPRSLPPQAVSAPHEQELGAQRCCHGPTVSSTPSLRSHHRGRSQGHPLLRALWERWNPFRYAPILLLGPLGTSLVLMSFQAPRRLGANKPLVDSKSWLGHHNPSITVNALN